MRMMKFVLFVALLVLPLVACDKNRDNSVGVRDVVLPGSQYPKEILAYVNTHFAGDQIVQVVKDYDDFVELTFDVMMKSGISLEFNRKWEIIKVEGNRNLPIPMSVIPQSIQDYLAANYAEFKVIKWEWESEHMRWYQNVTLDNGLELVFDANGSFFRIDS